MFQFKPARKIDVSESVFGSAVTSQDALYFTGMVSSTLERAVNPSLDTDKLDLMDLIGQIEADLNRKGMSLKTHGVYVNL